jgi:hypothetical protein
MLSQQECGEIEISLLVEAYIDITCMGGKFSNTFGGKKMHELFSLAHCCMYKEQKSLHCPSIRDRLSKLWYIHNGCIMQLFKKIKRKFLF